MTRKERENTLHCLKVMVEEANCEDCKLYGTTGTDHCERDCVRNAIQELEQETILEKSDNAMPYTRKLELTLFSVIRDRLVTEFKDKGAPELNNLAYELMQKTMYDAGGVDWEKAEESYIMGENMYYGLKGGKKHDE